MFTGIVEAMGQVTDLRKEGSNLHITLQAPFQSELKIDQSVAHNGVCLTVVELLEGDRYTVTAIKETLEKTNLSDLIQGSKVNLERCMPANGRLDGHIVQGHVDQTATVTEIQEVDGSWYFHFSYPTNHSFFTVPKGSITVNGTSLTVVDSEPGKFSVAIIPFTYEHTVFHTLKVGDHVNLEFDVIGKYVQQLMQPYLHQLSSK